ncbi:MAG TPA: nuclear transport factor 2 family protein [Candidatus Cybelea sp.]|nr:nuclear transport factor 2 family protein [Candidatus Cybelea sp.]
MAEPGTYPRAIYEKQLQCIVADDRETQLRLYAEDVVYEFPFATDRPRLIYGRDAFRRVMTPLWDQARRAGIKVTGYDYRLLPTADPTLIAAEMTFSVATPAKSAKLPVVQIMNIRRGEIASVREYFNPQARSELV